MKTLQLSQIFIYTREGKDLLNVRPPRWLVNRRCGFQGEAFGQGLASMKGQKETAMAACRSTTRRILRWAKVEGIPHIGEITPEQLDQR